MDWNDNSKETDQKPNDMRALVSNVSLKIIQQLWNIKILYKVSLATADNCAI